MTIPGSAPFASSPYGATPVIPVVGPEGGPYAVGGPQPVTLLPSAARTATTSTATQVNVGYRGLYLFLNVTVNPGGAQTLQVTLYAQDNVAGSVAAVLTVPASATPGGVWLVYPGASGAAADGIPLTRNLPLPQQWSVAVTHSGVGAWTYVLTAHLLP